MANKMKNKLLMRAALDGLLVALPSFLGIIFFIPGTFFIVIAIIFLLWSIFTQIQIVINEEKIYQYQTKIQYWLNPEKNFFCFLCCVAGNVITVFFGGFKYINDNLLLSGVWSNLAIFLIIFLIIPILYYSITLSFKNYTGWKRIIVLITEADLVNNGDRNKLYNEVSFSMIRGNEDAIENISIIKRNFLEKIASIVTKEEKLFEYSEHLPISNKWDSFKEKWLEEKTN